MTTSASNAPLTKRIASPASMKAKPGVNRPPPMRRRITRPRKYLCPRARSSLPHFLFAFPAAHPLLAPLPAHLPALLPGPRGAFHRVAGARLLDCLLSSFPCHILTRSGRRVQNVSRSDPTRALAPGDVHSAFRIEDQRDVIAVWEGEALRGNVGVAVPERGTLHLGGPRPASVRGTTIPDVERARAVVHPSHSHIVNRSRGRPGEEMEGVRPTGVELDSGREGHAAIRGRLVPDEGGTVVGHRSVVGHVQVASHVHGDRGAGAEVVPAAGGGTRGTRWEARVDVRARPARSLVRRFRDHHVLWTLGLPALVDQLPNHVDGAVRGHRRPTVQWPSERVLVDLDRREGAAPIVRRGDEELLGDRESYVNVVTHDG